MLDEKHPLRAGDEYKIDGTNETVRIEWTHPGSALYMMRDGVRHYLSGSRIAAFRRDHSMIEPEPEPKPEHTEETRTALTRLERAAEIVRLLDGLDRHETTATLLAVADALHCPIREQTAAEFESFCDWDADGDPYAD